MSRQWLDTTWLLKVTKMEQMGMKKSHEKSGILIGAVTERLIQHRIEEIMKLMVG